MSPTVRDILARLAALVASIDQAAAELPAEDLVGRLALSTAQHHLLDAADMLPRQTALPVSAAA